MLRLLLLAAALFSVPTYAQTYPAFAGKPIIDAADMIPPAEEEALNRSILLHQQKTKTEIALVTVPSLDGYDIETYSIGLFRKLGVGHKGLDNGVMLLVAPNEKRARIEVGYGLEPTLTDALSHQIQQDVIIPRFKKREMVGGAQDGINAIIKATTPLTPEELAQKKKLEEYERKQRDAALSGFLNFLGYLVTTIILAGIGITLYLLATRKRRAEKRALKEAAERDRLAKIEQEQAEVRARRLEQIRIAREHEAAQLRAAQEARAAFLSKLSPAEKEAFLAKEAADAEAARIRAAEFEAREAAKRKAQRKAREAREAREAAEEAAAERQRNSRSPSFDTNPSNNDSSGSTFDFGGGSGGGGGASSSWD